MCGTGFNLWFKHFLVFCFCSLVLISYGVFMWRDEEIKDTETISWAPICCSAGMLQRVWAICSWWGWAEPGCREDITTSKKWRKKWWDKEAYSVRTNLSWLKAVGLHWCFRIVMLTWLWYNYEKKVLKNSIQLYCHYTNTGLYRITII